MIDEKTLQAIRKYGLATIGVVVFAWIIYQFQIVPAQAEREDAREERKSNAKALLDSNKQVNETNASLAKSYEKMSTAIDSQTKLLQESTGYIKDVRDDQRRGVWRATEPPKPSELPKGVEPARE